MDQLLRLKLPDLDESVCADTDCQLVESVHTHTSHRSIMGWGVGGAEMG